MNSTSPSFLSSRTAREIRRKRTTRQTRTRAESERLTADWWVVSGGRRTDKEERTAAAVALATAEGTAISSRASERSTCNTCTFGFCSAPLPSPITHEVDRWNECRAFDPKTSSVHYAKTTTILQPPPSSIFRIVGRSQITIRV